MGLPVRQRRVLGRIECALRGSDPRLAALYSIFARLNRDEDIPRAEQMRHRFAVLASHVRWRAATTTGRVVSRLIPRQKAVLLFPLALVLLIGAVVFAVRTSGPSCTPALPLASTAQHPAQSKQCRGEPAIGLYGK